MGGIMILRSLALAGGERTKNERGGGNKCQEERAGGAKNSDRTGRLSPRARARILPVAPSYQN